MSSDAACMAAAATNSLLSTSEVFCWY